MFSENTKIICGSGEFVTSCFRRTFTSDRQEAMIRIAAKGIFVLWINGKEVVRRTLKSFDFFKQYDEIDISRYLVCGKNCIAVESAGAFIAEVYKKSAQEVLLCVTDEEFLWKGNGAYRKDTLGHSEINTLGQEEWYDSRKVEIGWTEADFDDSGWEYAFVSAEKWSGYQKYSAELLTDKPVYAKQVTAELACQMHPGKKMNLIPAGKCRPEETDNSYQVYLAEIFCEKDTEFLMLANNAVPRITVDGQPYQLGEKKTLVKGRHILCLSEFGCCELLIELPDAKLDAKAFCGQECEFAGFGLPQYRIRYWFCETNDQIRARMTEDDWIHQNCSVEELKSRYTFLPVKEYGESCLADAMFQNLYLPVGAECPPGLFLSKEIKDAEFRSPIVGSRYLLNAGGKCCEIRNESDHDALCILDFGQEICGHVSFAVEAGEGQLLDMQCFEVIDKGGVFIMSNYNGFRYITREGYQEYTTLSRYGFRYIMIMVRNKGTVRFHDIHIEETLYPVERKGSFRCNDNNLNLIYDMCLNTSSLCLLDTYVDCPGHEQNFWVGDADITGRNNMIHFGEYEFDQHCLEFAGRSVSEEYRKQLFAEDSDFQAGKYITFSHYNLNPKKTYLIPIWTFLWVQQIWDHHMYSGRMDHLEENYRYLQINLRNIKNTMLNSRGLFDLPGAQNLIEWANNDLSPYGEVTASNIMLVNSWRIAAKIADILGDAENSKMYRQEAETLFDRINELCWNEKMQGYVDTVRDAYAYERYCDFCRENGYGLMNYEDYLSCTRVSEQTNTLALLYDCVPESRKENVIKIAARAKDGKYFFGAPAFRAVGEPEKNAVRDGIVMTGSPFFLFFTLGTLFKYQMPETALKIMRKEWGNMLEKGINTCWETMEMEGTMYTRSICHAWSAAPSIYLTENVLGIKPLEPGYRKFTVNPTLCDLAWAQGSVATPYGIIYVKAEKKEDGSCAVACQAPKECVWEKTRSRK